MEENIQQEPINEQKGSYLIGTIGAVIGGLVASIPWILIYSFGNMIVALLATLIAGGAFLGYKIFKGKIGKALPVIITLVSIITVVLVTLVICPMILLAKEGLDVSIANLKMMYSIEEMKSAIINNLIISLLFTVLGIAAVVRSISLQIKNGASYDKLQFNTNAVIEEHRKEVKEACEIIKKVCTTLNCMNKENTLTKQEIINELEMTHNIEHKKTNQYLAVAIGAKLLKKYKGKYYYDKTDEQIKIDKVCNLNYNKGSYKTLICVIILAIIVGVVASNLTTPSGENYVIPSTEIEISTTNNQFLYNTEEELLQLFGEEYAGYYNFAIIEKSSGEYELYGTLINKAELGEEYDINSFVQTDRDYVASILGENITSQVLEIKLGETNFKTYNYKAPNQTNGEYIIVVYIADIGDQFLLIDFNADSNFGVTKANEVMGKLFK